MILSLRLGRLAVTLLLFALSLGALHAHSQEMTEGFIPIGRSPGLSGKVTALGAVQDVQGRALTIRSESGTRRFEIGDRTVIWIDRSQQKRSNSRGGVADLRSGSRVEVRPDAKDTTLAQWIKVEASGN